MGLSINFMRDGVPSLFNYPNLAEIKPALEISSFFNREALKKDISVDICLWLLFSTAQAFGGTLVLTDDAKSFSVLLFD